MKISKIVFSIFLLYVWITSSYFTNNPLDENVDYKPTQLDNLEVIQNINGSFNNPGSFAFSFTLKDNEGHNLFFLPHQNFNIYIGKQLVKNLLFQNSYDNYKIYMPRLPYQKYDGGYDLRIQVFSKNRQCLDIVKKNFLRYHSHSINLILIVDTSSSMYWNDKPNFRQRAIKNILQYAKISGTVSKIALVRFSTFPQTLCPLTSIQNRTQIEKAINEINENGETDIGSALDKAYEELLKTSKQEKTITILLTDGENGAPYKKNHMKYNNFHSPVYTIGLKQSIDVELLNEIAKETGGQFYKIFDSFKLQNIYNEIINREVNSKIFISKDFNLRPNQITNITFYPDRSMKKINIFSYWDNGDISISINPHLQKYNLFKFNHFQFFDLRDLSYKKYVFQIKNLTNQWNQFSLQGFVNSTISINSLLSKDVYCLNEPVEMSILAFQDDYPIMNSSITVNIMDDKKAVTIPLYDDGLHNDGDKNDGLYKNYFFNRESGDYKTIFKITGKNLYGEKFSREYYKTFVTLNKENTDLKIVPDTVTYEKIGSELSYYQNFKLLSSYSNPASIKVFPLESLYQEKTNISLSSKILIKPDYFLLEPQKNKLFNVKINIATNQQNGNYIGNLILIANDNFFVLPLKIDYYQYYLPKNEDWIKR